MVEVIAEGGVTHQGDINIAKKLAEDALTAGADVFKTQVWLTDKLVKKTHPEYALLERHALKWADAKLLAKHCEDIGIEFMATPGEVDSLKFLVEECGIKRIKIGSDDLTYKPLIEAAARTELPVIISTGMATIEEIRNTLIWHNPSLEYDEYNTPMPLDGYNVTLLHCTSLYPCPPDKANLLAINELKHEFPYVDVGFSDHTVTNIASIIAISLGAIVIEKHFCPNGYKGFDWQVSLTPVGFRLFIGDLRAAAKLLGNGKKQPCYEETLLIPKYRKGPDGFRGH